MDESFEQTQSYDKVYDLFDILIERKMPITGYVTMPNHCHFIVFYPEKKQSLNTIVGNGKRFFAYEIVSRLKAQKDAAILNLLAEEVTPSDKKKGKLHKVFRYSFDAKLIYNTKMMEDKLKYIHNNPISKKWNLAKEAESYQHSSAAFYTSGKTNFRWLKHFMDI